jgi:hypothetical protein
LTSQGTISLSKTALRELCSLMKNVGLYSIDRGTGFVRILPFYIPRTLIALFILNVVSPIVTVLSIPN